MTYDINLNWKSFNVDLNTINIWMKTNFGVHYCGLSANSQLQIHFTENPGSTVVSEIVYYWAHINNSSLEATNYMSETDRAAAAAANRAAKLASAINKLELLGLSDDEIKAILGQ